MRKKLPLYIQILIGMAVGILIGYIALSTGNSIIVDHWIYPWGRVFIRLLQLIAIPLVFVSLVKGVLGLNDVAKFSKMGFRTVGIYICTTIFAVALGLVFASVVKPGNLVDRANLDFGGTDYNAIVDDKLTAAGEISRLGPLAFLDDIVPDNIVGAAASNSNMLKVIFFAIFFAVAALTVRPEKVRPVAAFFDGVNDIILRMVDYIIRIAPYGVAALMAGIITGFEGESSIFSALAVYCVTVVAALVLMIVGFYPLLVKLFTNIGVKRFITKMYPVQLFAFTTSSSAATLPVNLETVERELGVSEEAASFVLPVGTTINMDGTSCYQAIAVLFIAQVLGIDLTVGQIFVVLSMTVLSSIGTPAIPGGSYVILTMVLTSVGIPPEGLALILAVDRPLDMLRTAVNVTGDAAVAAIVDRSIK
ncbi:MAG: dicarboxylate/amino acid:cation symporter [Rikenellaceae bacterium]|nr:dicarboxylate/amino acid:cation symporter [Rikenellaceae bacterium]